MSASAPFKAFKFGDKYGRPAFNFTAPVPQTDTNDTAAPSLPSTDTVFDWNKLPDPLASTIDSDVIRRDPATGAQTSSVVANTTRVSYAQYETKENECLRLEDTLKQKIIEIEGLVEAASDIRQQADKFEKDLAAKSLENTLLVKGQAVLTTERDQALKKLDVMKNVQKSECEARNDAENAAKQAKALKDIAESKLEEVKIQADGVGYTRGFANGQATMVEKEIDFKNELKVKEDEVLKLTKELAEQKESDNAKIFKLEGLLDMNKVVSNAFYDGAVVNWNREKKELENTIKIGQKAITDSKILASDLEEVTKRYNTLLSEMKAVKPVEIRPIEMTTTYHIVDQKPASWYLFAPAALILITIMISFMLIPAGSGAFGVGGFAADNMATRLHASWFHAMLEASGGSVHLMM